jgi:Fic family protein
MNRGELTYFCNIFLDILIDSQKNIIVELKENKALLDAFLRVIQNEKRLQNELQESILFILAQNFFFSASEQGMTRKKLSGAAGVSEYKIQKEAGQLIEKGMLAVKGKRPIYYSLNKSFFGLETK